MDTLIFVPVRSYVLKYIESKFGPSFHDKAWRIDKRHKEGRYFINLLERAPNRYAKYEKSEAILKILVPSDLSLRKGCYITPDNIADFIQYIRSSILDEVVHYCNDVKEGVGLKDCDQVSVITGKYNNKIKRIHNSEGPKFFSQKDIIIQKLKKFNIEEDDMTFDSVAKHVQRSAVHKISA